MISPCYLRCHDYLAPLFRLLFYVADDASMCRRDALTYDAFSPRRHAAITLPL